MNKTVQQIIFKENLLEKKKASCFLKQRNRFKPKQPPRNSIFSVILAREDRLQLVFWNLEGFYFEKENVYTWSVEEQKHTSVQRCSGYSFKSFILVDPNTGELAAS